MNRLVLRNAFRGAQELVSIMVLRIKKKGMKTYYKKPSIQRKRPLKASSLELRQIKKGLDYVPKKLLLQHHSSIILPSLIKTFNPDKSDGSDSYLCDLQGDLETF